MNLDLFLYCAEQLKMRQMSALFFDHYLVIRLINAPES